MAYKFQLGAFTASGSLTTEGNLLAKGSALSGSSLSIGGVAVTATPAELSVLDGLAQGGILLGDGSGAAAVLDASTDGRIMVGNGTTVTSVAVSGDVTLSNAGVVTIGAGAVEHGMLNDNIISGQGALGGATVAQADLLMIDDGPGTVKKVTFSNFEDSIFANISGDAAVAAGGALTIAANAVEGTMLHSNTVSGAINLANDKLGLTGSALGLGLNFEGDHSHVEQIFVDIESLGALGGTGVAQSDNLMFSDAGDLKKITFSNFEDAIFGNVSGDATIAAGGALTIGAGAVEHGMLNDNIISGQSNLGGTGVADADEFLFSDAGTVKALTFANLYGAVFSQVSGDATLNAGGDITIGANAVEGTMLNSNTVSGAINLANDKIGLSGSVAGEGLSFTGDHSHVTTLSVGAGNGISVAGSQVSLQLDTGANGNVSFDVGGNGLSLKSNVAGTGIALASGVLSFDPHGQLVEAAGLVQSGDKFVITDANNSNGPRRVSFANARDAVYSDVSGDATIATGGALTIAANAVEGSMLNSNAVSGAINLADNKLGLSGSVAGNGLKFQNALQNGFGDHSHIEKLAVQLESTNALSVSSNGIDLKGTIAGDRTFSGDVKVGGDLFVTGTTVTVNSTSIMVTGSITFEGSTDDGNETTLGVVDPDADRTINLANASGTLIPFAAASTTTISSTPGELNLLDGSAKSTSSITVDDADAIIIIDGTTTKQIPASDLKTYIGNTSNLDVSLKENGNALAVGVNYFANLAAAASGSLPASPSVGDAVYVKAPANCSSTNTLQIAAVGSHQVDGADQIVLESPHAAVMCVYVVANVWKVF